MFPKITEAKFTQRLSYTPKGAKDRYGEKVDLTPVTDVPCITSGSTSLRRGNDSDNDTTNHSIQVKSDVTINNGDVINSVVTLQGAVLLTNGRVSRKEPVIHHKLGLIGFTFVVSTQA